jgi:hypothetical protein
MGGVLLILSTKPAKKAGNFVGIMIFLLVKTLSAKGTIIAKETPSKTAEKAMHIEARENRPK